MLRPTHRELLLDALRPEPGFTLDRAVGTTFSLDLDALLTTPLAFALFDVDSSGGSADPMALLAAIKSYARRMTLYCDAAHIAVPDRDNALFQLLEPIVRPVLQPGGAFHPKLWVLRFRAADDDELRHRVLVLSRNLTFDRSWDTLLRLDEDADVDGDRPPNTSELADFLGELARRAPSAAIEDLLLTLPGVSLAAPTPFSSLRFWTVGAGRSDPLGDVAEAALLVVSPFATPRRLDTLAPLARRRVLVTRTETLDNLGARALREWDETYVLHGEAMDGVEGTELSGLHAKVFIVDDGREQRVFTGSANATSAAFERNVELLVELRSTHRTTRVAALLDDHDELGFRRLLVARGAADEEPIEETAEEAERARLESLVAALAAQALTADAHADDEGRWSVTVRLNISEVGFGSHDALRARPVTATTAWQTMTMSEQRAEAVLPLGAPSRVTSLVAFELAARGGIEVEPVRFVLVADLQGAPADREERLLLDMLPDADRVMRLLFLLLADGRHGQEASGEVRRLLGAGTDGESWAPALPLFENLVRTFARDPGRLATVRGVVEQLSATEEGRRRLPDRFLDLWTAFDAALAADGSS